MIAVGSILVVVFVSIIGGPSMVVGWITFDDIGRPVSDDDMIITVVVTI